MADDIGDVDHYIDNAADQRKAALTALRSSCLDELPEFNESLEYGMPSYSRAGEVEIAFASRRQYISLHVLRTDVMARHRKELKHLNVGRGCIRYRKPEDIDFSVVRSILRDTARSTGPIC